MGGRNPHVPGRGSVRISRVCGRFNLRLSGGRVQVLHHHFLFGGLWSGGGSRSRRRRPADHGGLKGGVRLVHGRDVQGVAVGQHFPDVVREVSGRNGGAPLFVHDAHEFIFHAGDFHVKVGFAGMGCSEDVEFAAAGLGPGVLAVAFKVGADFPPDAGHAHFLLLNGLLRLFQIGCRMFKNVQQAEELFMVTVELNIPVICYGLRSDFSLKGFPGSTRLLELAHTIEEMKTICTCGRKATCNCRRVNGEFVFEGEQVAIDLENDVQYVSMCPQCYFKARRAFYAKRNAQ